MKTVNVLWTGGWDSSFRILQLSTKDVIVQPYYLKDNRKSEKNELGVIYSLTEEIRNMSSTKCILNDVIAINVSDVAADKGISEAIQEVEKTFFQQTKRKFGSQYNWLARFSKTIGNLELSVEKGSKIIDVIRTYGESEKVVDDKIGEYYQVNKSKSPKNIITAYGNFHLPLVTYTKLMMKKEAEDKGFISLLNKTWFCLRPIDELPCGICLPCAQTIEAGFQYRFPPAALRRYKNIKLLNPMKSTILSKGIKKIYWNLNK